MLIKYSRIFQKVRIIRLIHLIEQRELNVMYQFGITFFP